MTYLLLQQHDSGSLCGVEYQKEKQEIIETIAMEEYLEKGIGSPPTGVRDVLDMLHTPKRNEEITQDGLELNFQSILRGLKDFDETEVDESSFNIEENLLENSNLRDEDDDGYSSCEGYCSDLDPLVYTGVAYLEQDLLCMRDADGDGYGDSNPPARVSPGSDCDDTDANMGPFDADNDGMEECSIMLHLSMET